MNIITQPYSNNDWSLIPFDALLAGYAGVESKAVTVKAWKGGMIQF